ncbi:MAG TPA: hypothetical protein VGC90_03900 [Candidatus Limnocylindrales bacterium]
MHQQIRCLPKLSPPDLEKLLAPIAAKGINILAAGGGSLEYNGEFAFSVEDGREEETLQILRDLKYRPRLIRADDPRLTVCRLEDKAGELHRCVAAAAEQNLREGRIIHDLIIGKDDEGYAVQIYSEHIRTPQALSDTGTRR